LDGSFLAQPQADVLGQQGHDDLAEEPDGVLVELGLEGVVEFGDVLVLAHHGVEGEEGAGAAADGAFGPPTGDGGLARLPPVGGPAFHRH